MEERDNTEYIKIEQPNGEIVEAELILTVHLDRTNKDYMVYSFDETLEEDKAILYTSEVIWHDDGSCSIETIEDASVWDEIKQIMKNIIKENSGE